MKVGDRVLVTVRGERVPATVEEPYTALGCVRVKLDTPVTVEGVAIPLSIMVRAYTDVEPLRELPTIEWARHVVDAWAGQEPKADGALWAAALLAEHERAEQADRALTETLVRLEQVEEWADRLAYAIAPQEVIGEHSSLNNPWWNALEHARTGEARKAALTEGLRAALCGKRAELISVRRYVPLPDDNGGADFDLVVVDADGRPACREHGAMNRVSAEGWWRCITTSGPRGNPCRAGCREQTDGDAT